MKKLLLILLLATFSMLSAKWIDIDENKEVELFDHTSSSKAYTEVYFSLNGYEIETKRENEIDYQKISYINEGNLLAVGKPDLPKFTRLLAVPAEGTVNFEVIVTETEVIEDIDIYPAQVLQSESDSKPFKFVTDEAYYTNGTLYPSDIVEIGEPVILRDQRVVSVSINPFQYDPQSRTLHIVKNVDIAVSSSGKGGGNIKDTDRKVSRFFEPIYRSAIMNYDSTVSRDLVYQDPSYLFIYPNDATLLSNLEYISDWKHQKGFEVTLASTTETGTTSNSIKNYIQNAYDNWENPPEFVCLVGDVGGSYSIPTFYINYYNAEGDHPYAQLEGNDVLEDVFLGRISISSITELQTYVSKILNYEKEPFMGETDWYDRAVLVGDPSSSGPSTVFTNQFVAELMHQYAPNIITTEVYSGNYDSAMSSNLNSGVTYLNYRGYIGMSGFDNYDITSLSNGLKLPFAVFLTCSTGSFASGTSRSETFIRAGNAGNQKGAIAAIGTATSGTHTNFNNCIDAGIYYGIFSDEIYNPGGAVNRGKLALYEHYPQNPLGHVDNFTHMNTLIGDPGVELWTGVPQDLVVEYETDVSPGTNYLEVTVTDDNGIPLENAWVSALMGDDVIFVTGYTDVNGYVAIEINANQEGSADLTVTKHNYIPHLGGFDVGEVIRFVNVQDTEIDDDNSGTSSGNDDGMLNPGEDIELKVSLKNYGSLTASLITATISTDNDFITITDAVEDFGSIASGSTAFCTDDFDISIDEDVLGGTEIKLDIVIEDNAGNSWNDIIYLVVEGPNIVVTDYSIEDSNGYLDPGETEEMIVEIQNNGLVTANMVYGQLVSTDIRLTVTDAEGYFATVAGEGGMASNTSDTFEVTASAQLVIGTQIMMELNLYNTAGYDSTVQFILGIGEVSITDPVGPDTYGYFCYDDEDLDYLSVPTYDWIEINNIGTNLNLYDGGDDGDSQTISDLPITFRMYGEEYDSATVCSNGWIAPGGSSQASFMNSPIPGPQGPSPMIAPFWDDLKTGSGGVYWYYDSSLHIMIIEWDHMQNDYNNDEETFQVLLYDANYYPTTTGDSEIIFQYKVINNTNPGSYPSQHGQYSSVGIEDHTGTMGLEYTFNNSYPAAAKHLQNEMALKITGPTIPLEEPFLVLGGVTLFDENGNGLADFGEDVAIDILLNNLGNNPATNISAVISSTDEFITINQDTSIFNNIQGGGSANSQTDFEISVAEDSPDGHVASFEMIITSNENSWILHFTITLNAPVIEFHSLFIDDGGNNILDPGETADMYVSYINNGGSDATNVITELTESDPYVTLNSSTHTFITLNGGTISTCMFNVTASSSAPIGHLANVNWTMSGDNNYNANGSFNLIISQVPVLLDEDFVGTFPPDGWTLSGQNAGNWTQSATNNSGGSSPEAKFTWLPSFTGVSRLVSPIMNTSGSTSLDFEFRHFLNDYSGSGYSISVRTTSDGGSTWNTAWDVTPSGDIGPELKQLTISTSDVGSQNFQIALVFDGYSFNLDYWYIDNIHMEGGQGTAVGFIDGLVTLGGGVGEVEDVVITAGDYITSPDDGGNYIIPLPGDIYDVIASLEGYETKTEYDIQVLPNQTSTVNFELTYLQAPTDLVASVASNDVSLEWNMTTMRTFKTKPTKEIIDKLSSRNEIQNEESNTIQTLHRSLIGFKVYRNNLEIVQIEDPGQLTYSDNGLDSGDYSYYVTALYSDNNESLPTNTQLITVVLDAPTNLIAEAQDPNIILDWDAPTTSRSLTGYRIYRNGVSIVDVTETTYIDTDLPSDIYTYFVTGIYGAYESEPTNEVTIDLTMVDDPLIPTNTELNSNYPNPFNPTTTISYSISEPIFVNIAIYNVKGAKVKNLVDGDKEAGFHSVVWDGKDHNGKKVASGIYLYRFNTSEVVQIKKMMLIK